MQRCGRVCLSFVITMLVAVAAISALPSARATSTWTPLTRFTFVYEFDYMKAQGTVTVFQDPATRDLQVELTISSTSWNAYGSGTASGATCDDRPTYNPNGSWIIWKVFRADNSNPNFVSESVEYDHGSTGFCDLSDAYYVEPVFFSAPSSYAYVTVSAAWQTVYTNPLTFSTFFADQHDDFSCLSGSCNVLSLLPATATLTGQVTAADGSGVVGATVTAQSPLETYTTTTGSGGSYSLSGMLPDTYTVTASACGVSAPPETVTVPDASVTPATTYSPQLAISTGTLYGYVRDSSSGNAISGATVADGCTGRTASTNSNGYYSFSIGAGKAITYTAYAAGYNSESQTVTVSAGGSYNMNFGLSPKPSHCNQPGCCTSAGCFQNPPP